MHKRIVHALEKLFNEWDKEQEHKWLDIFVKTQDTNGFWGMCIIVQPERIYILTHLKSIALSVGCIYGEGLNINIKDNLIKID